jgi:hypothetical protein
MAPLESRRSTWCTTFFLHELEPLMTLESMKTMGENYALTLSVCIAVSIHWIVRPLKISKKKKFRPPNPTNPLAWKK